jgi:hypothetical protein
MAADYIMLHWPFAMALVASPRLGSCDPPGISGIIPAPIFGMIGIPFSSNFKPGARSRIISAGGWPNCWMSNMSSINLGTGTGPSTRRRGSMRRLLTLGSYLVRCHRQLITFGRFDTVCHSCCIHLRRDSVCVSRDKTSRGGRMGRKRPTC